MNPARILGMEIDELALRARQEASKLLDRAGLPSRVRSRRESETDLRLGGVFFRGAESPALPALLEEASPGERDAIIESADAIVGGRLDLLGYRGLSFGSPIDWTLDPISGRRSPLAHWSRLDPLDAGSIGDVKVVWELGRHQWLVPLGQAWRLTGDERYAAEAARRVREWIASNPRGMGIHWASSLEAALRLISWCWAAFLMKDSAAWRDPFLEGLAAGIQSHAAHVAWYLSIHSSPNTHLTGEALGLFYAGVLLPDSRSSRRWREMGLRLLEEECRRQILPDGVHFERSTCYQRYTVEIYLHLVILARLNGIAPAADVERGLLRAVDALLALRRPGGGMPALGDSDGGALLPLARRGEGDMRGLFSTMAALFGRDDYAWAAGGAAPESLWLLGADGLEAFRILRPSPPAAAPSVLLPEGGYAVMRSGWDEGAHQLTFDVGPLGCPATAGHGHADLLAIECVAHGAPLIVDPGTFVYAADRAWRDHFRSTAAHGTVLVDGEPQAEPAGPFRWRSKPAAALRRWISTEAIDFADAAHGAYARLPDPVLHRRRILFVKPLFWLLVDDLEGDADHRVEVRFQLAPLRVEAGPDGWIRAAARGGVSLFLKAFSPSPLALRIREGETDPAAGWISPAYGVRVAAPAVAWEARTRLPLRIATLLWPSNGEGIAPPDARASFTTEGALAGIDLGAPRGRLDIGDTEIAFRRD